MGSGFLGKDGLKYQVFPMTPADLDRVVCIERLSFTHPWTMAQFLEELNRQPLARCLVSTRGKGACGYVMAWLVVDELHITNLAVDPSVRGRGVARGLITTLIRNTRSEGAVWSALEVRESNLAARALYKGLGFTVLGSRKGYYPDGEDALVMGMEM